MKNFILGAVILLALPLSANAQSYNQPQGFFWPYGTGIGAPREVLTVHSWGPTQAPAYHSMSGAPSPWQTIYPQQTFPTFQQPYQQYPQYQQPYAQPQQQSFFQPIYTFPQFVPQQYNYHTPQLNYGYQQPQYMPSYSYGYGGGYGGYGQPDGGTDIWGNPSCNWGDYRGYGCSYDPHQWIYDPYTGTYY